MRLFLLLFIAFFVSITKAQTSDIPWRTEPWTDSIDQACKDSILFRIYSKGKTGWYHTAHGQMLAPAFDEASQPTEIFISSWRYNWLSKVRIGNYWGVYRIEKSFGIDTTLILDFEYDQVEFIMDDNKMKIHLKQGKKSGVFNPYYDNWDAIMEEPGKLYPPQKGVDMVVFQPPMIEDSPADLPPNKIGEPGVSGEDGENAVLRRKLNQKKGNSGRGNPYPEGSRGDGNSGRGETRSPYPDDITSPAPLATNGKAKNLYLRFQKTPGNNLCGIYNKSADSFLIKPNFQRIELHDSFFYCYYPDYPKVIQVYNLSGEILTPLSYAIDRFAFGNKLNILTLLNNKKQLYNKQFQLLLPNMYSEVKTTPNEDLIYMNTGHVVYFYNSSKLQLLADSFDQICLKGDDGKWLCKKQNDLYIYNIFTQKSKKIKSVEFISGIDSMAVISKKKKAFLLNLNTGKAAKKGWESIYSVNNVSMEKISQRTFPVIFLVREKGKLGLINSRNEILVKPEYDSLLNSLIQFPELISFKKNSLIYVYHIFKKEFIFNGITSIQSKDVAYNFPDGGNFRDENRLKRTWLVIYEQQGKLGYLAHPDSSICAPEFSGFTRINSRIFFRKGNKYIYFNPLKPNCSNGLEFDSVRFNNFIFTCIKDSLVYSMKIDNQIFPPHGTKELKELKIAGAWNPVYFYKENGLLGMIGVDYNSAPVLEDYQTGANGLLWLKYKGMWGISKD